MPRRRRTRDGEPAFKLSLNDFVIKALALALQRVPAANAVWARDRILRFKHSDIGVAVALDGGLVTPVIRSAETKSLTAISAEMKDLAARARDSKLKPAEYQGGAIGDLQSRHVRRARIRRHHQSAARHHPRGRRRAPAGRSRRPMAASRFASMMTVTLSCDHRVVDGALGAELLAAIKSADRDAGRPCWCERSRQWRPTRSEILLVGPASRCRRRARSRFHRPRPRRSAGSRRASSPRSRHVRGIAVTRRSSRSDRRRRSCALAQARDRCELRRRLRPYRRQWAGAARHHRHQHAGRAQRGGRRYRARPAALHGARIAAGRALSARRQMAQAATIR